MHTCMCIYVYEWEKKHITLEQASQLALVEKNPPANAGDIRDAG